MQSSASAASRFAIAFSWAAAVRGFPRSVHDELLTKEVWSLRTDSGWCWCCSRAYITVSAVVHVRTLVLLTDFRDPYGL